jgi:hypothetical protein
VSDELADVEERWVRGGAINRSDVGTLYAEVARLRAELDEERNARAEALSVIETVDEIREQRDALAAFIERRLGPAERDAAKRQAEALASVRGDAPREPDDPGRGQAGDADRAASGSQGAGTEPRCTAGFPHFGSCPDPACPVHGDTSRREQTWWVPTSLLQDRPPSFDGTPGVLVTLAP